jgi:hypothetical protein
MQVSEEARSTSPTSWARLTLLPGLPGKDAARQAARRFYNMAAEDERLARAVAQAVREHDPDLLRQVVEPDVKSEAAGFASCVRLLPIGLTLRAATWRREARLAR